ncbi:integrin alpha [Pontiellaceae bacterium B12219]|nr:integrin alpha [Pontiellaceae bacterium B12219]
MKALRYFILLLVLPAFGNTEKTYTKEEIFRFKADPEKPVDRYFCELDLNQDGIQDLLISKPIYSPGTGGRVYELFIGDPNQQFKKIDTIQAGTFAIEKHNWKKRLWFWTHSSSQSGSISFRYFDRYGNYHQSGYVEILSGDGGSKIGNDIFNSIFNEKSTLSFKKYLQPEA